MEGLIEAAFLGESGPYCASYTRSLPIWPGSGQGLATSPPPTADVQDPGCAKPTAALDPRARSLAQRSTRQNGAGLGLTDGVGQNKAEWDRTGQGVMGKDREGPERIGQGLARRKKGAQGGGTGRRQ